MCILKDREIKLNIQILNNFLIFGHILFLFFYFVFNDKIINEKIIKRSLFVYVKIKKKYQSLIYMYKK